MIIRYHTITTYQVPFFSLSVRIRCLKFEAIVFQALIAETVEFWVLITGVAVAE